jgi:hypothetical protein
VPDLYSPRGEEKRKDSGFFLQREESILTIAVSDSILNEFNFKLK